MAGTRFPVQVIFKKALNVALMAKAAVDAADRVLKSESHIMERDMKHNAPTSFGPLRAHVGVVGPLAGASGDAAVPGQTGLFGTGVFYEVGVRALNYAKFVEFGTGPAGQASSNILPIARQAMRDLGYVHGPGNFLPPIENIERWLKRKGLPLELAYVVARAIGRRGLEPQPFVFPAYERRRQGIPGKVSAAVARVVGK